MHIASKDVQWVVNELGELGVKIGNQFFFLYKGESLVYSDYPDAPKYYRPVAKREFGETCQSPETFDTYSGKMPLPLLPVKE